MATRFRIEIKLIATSGPDYATGGGEHTAYVRDHEKVEADTIYEALAMVDWLAQTDLSRRTETVDCPGCESVPECTCVMEGAFRRCGICDSLYQNGRCGTFERVRK